MGIIRNAKSDKLATDAQKAYAAGQFFFSALLNYPHWTFGASGEIPDWSAMIEAIERQGWVLTHWSAGVDAKGNPQAYPVFRRRQ